MTRASRTGAHGQKGRQRRPPWSTGWKIRQREDQQFISSRRQALVPSCLFFCVTHFLLVVFEIPLGRHPHRHRPSLRPGCARALSLRVSGFFDLPAPPDDHILLDSPMRSAHSTSSPTRPFMSTHASSKRAITCFFSLPLHRRSRPLPKLRLSTSEPSLGSASSRRSRTHLFGRRTSMSPSCRRATRSV